MSNARQKALELIANQKHDLERIDFKKTQIKDLYGANVFNEVAQRERLPKPVFKALQKTIKHGDPLPSDIADVVATAMKDWALDGGATHYTQTISNHQEPS